MIKQSYRAGTTTGFMDLTLLKKRAEKIPSTGSSSNRLDGDLRLILGVRFTCSGSLTGLMLGADVRPGGGRNQYPEVQIWSVQNANKYNYRSSHEIRLSQGNFSPDGVLQYNLNPALSFQSGDVLGVWQPASSSSVVRLYHDGKIDGPSSYELNSNPKSSINVNSAGGTYKRSNILIHAITTGQFRLIIIMFIYNNTCTLGPSCINNFPITMQELRQKALDVNINSVVVRDQQQRLFPDIYFTASGSITKWIMGAGTGGGSASPSELQIWRRSGSDYTKVGSTQLTAQSSTDSHPNVYEYIPSSPLGFKEGDILGVYQRSDSGIVPYYQDNTGPENRRQSGLVSSALNNLVTPSLAAEYDYPLVTVETGKQCIFHHHISSLNFIIGPPVTSIAPLVSTAHTFVTRVISTSNPITSTILVALTTASFTTGMSPVLSEPSTLVTTSIMQLLSITKAPDNSIVSTRGNSQVTIITQVPDLKGVLVCFRSLDEFQYKQMYIFSSLSL